MDTVGRGWDRLLALLFLAIVIAAVALLISGYGVAVGSARSPVWFSASSPEP